jgi:hypothetical protein
MAKKLPLTFCKIFENVQFFRYYDPKKIFLEKYKYFMLISNLLMPAFRNTPIKS